MEKIKKICIFLLGIMLFWVTVSFAATGTVDAPNGLVLRKEAAKTADAITTISNKTEVQIIEKSGDWYKVNYDNKEGYLYAEYVIKKEETPVIEQSENQTSVETPAITEGISPAVQEETYPKDVAITNAVKVYVIPSITSTIVNNIETGKTVTINKKLNEWVYITFEGKSGWARNNIVNGQVQQTASQEPKTEELVEQQQPTTVQQNKKGYINASTSANLRETASTSAEILTSLTTNTEVTINGEEGSWYKVTYKDYNGYISKELISDSQITSRSQTTARQQTQASSNQSTPTYTESNSASGDAIVAFAKQYLGYSYVSGGTTPSNGFDCTGFTYYVYNNCGYSLSRSCPVQASTGTSVTREELQPGDLLVFNNGGNGTIGHVGIYIGNGMFIHAANSRRGVVTDTINSGYYNTYYYDARRIV